MKIPFTLIGLLALFQGSQELNSDITEIINVKIWVAESVTSVVTKSWIKDQFHDLNGILANSGVKIIALPFNIEVTYVPNDQDYVSVQQFRELRETMSELLDTADMAILITNYGIDSKLGSFDEPLGVVGYDTSNFRHALLSEIFALTMGCRYEGSTPAGTQPDYGQGFVTESLSTVLTGPQANVISYFSSFDPDVTYEGQNVGDADHDCARVLNERRSIFTDIGSEKNFRCDPEIDGNFATGNCEPTYWACSGGYQYKMDCSAEEAGLVYEPSTNRCEYPEDFNCV